MLCALCMRVVLFLMCNLRKGEAAKNVTLQSKKSNVLTVAVEFLYCFAQKCSMYNLSKHRGCCMIITEREVCNLNIKHAVHF